MSLPHLLRAATVTADMIERRDIMRRLYGDQYSRYVQDAKVIVRDVAKRDGSSIVQAALTICTQDLCEEENQ